MTGAVPTGTPEAVLQTVFGYQAFRAPQGEIIRHILAGRDAVALMPTGAGKSLCYQISSLCLPGTGLVISPLVSLMRAQVKELKDKGIKAAALHSGLTPAEQNDTLRNLAGSNLDILYLAPERAASRRL